MTKIKPFKISINQAVIDDLKTRLNLMRWPDEADHVGWNYGVPLKYLKFLTAYWLNDYDWSKHEAILNSFEQSVIEIDGHSVHFIHHKSQCLDAIPLLLIHGWPGSIIEYLPIIEALVNPDTGTQAFHVIIPTLPGFGFSGPTSGWSVKRCAQVFHDLMCALDYTRYFVHGEDVGSLIAREMGMQVGENLVAIHVTQLFHDSEVYKMIDENDSRERITQAKHYRYQTDLQAYALLQATRPQSLAYALNDSPVGLLAWILERFYDWTERDKLPHEVVDKDLLLTNVMVYWLNQTIGSSARYYATGSESWQKTVAVSKKPTAYLQMPDDISHAIKRIAILENKIFRWSEAPVGGHFCALEQPEVLIADLRESFHGSDFNRRIQ